MSAQIIEKNGKAEGLDDVLAFDKAMHELEVSQDELVPAEIAKRLLGGKESPLKIWREFRDMMQEQLAEQASISQGQVALIEGGTREGKVSVLKDLANALNADLDDLV